MEELVFFKELGKVHINILVKQDKNLNSGLMKGSLTNSILQDFLPPPSADTFVLASGSDELKQQVQQYLNNN